MKNLCTPGTIVWYFNKLIQSPHQCVYASGVRVDKGCYSNQHLVKFNKGKLTRVSEKELYVSECAARSAVESNHPSVLHDLHMLAAVYKLKT